MGTQFSRRNTRGSRKTTSSRRHWTRLLRLQRSTDQEVPRSCRPLRPTSLQPSRRRRWHRMECPFRMEHRMDRPFPTERRLERHIPMERRIRLPERRIPMQRSLEHRIPTQRRLDRRIPMPRHLGRPYPSLSPHLLPQPTLGLSSSGVQPMRYNRWSIVEPSRPILLSHILPRPTPSLPSHSHRRRHCPRVIGSQGHVVPPLRQRNQHCRARHRRLHAAWTNSEGLPHA
mmetsp:Transcript_54334/g.161363  ORF Transcript_54334/g.161363 Transcript_54334/m.161363 type:complete len:229 (-) Transcript_54334:438-1124(-)